MKINGLGPIMPEITKTATSDSSPKTSFMDYLKEAINEVENLQADAQKKAQEVMSGDAQSIHQSMIANEKANLALQLTIEVRSKILEAYQEIMRMQM